MLNRSVRAVLVSSIVLPACLTAAEMGRRILDGYRVWSVALVRNPSSTDLTWSTGRSTGGLLKTIPLDIDADTAWFSDRPQPIQGTDPDWAEKRRIAFDAATNYVWNAATLKGLFVQSYLANLRTSRAPGPEEIFTFRSPDGGPYPLYRFYPDIQTGSGFSNRFGWRGRPITAEKPPNVIRIGILGDSTTGAYPGMVEHWLNLWAARRNLGVRFEIINAARPATNALDAAAILDVELGSIDLDYVIIYGFGNAIHVADALINLPLGLVRGVPASATAGYAGHAGNAGLVSAVSTRVSATLEPWARWSAAAGFLRSRMIGRRGGDVPEPPKPATEIEFPPDIDEKSPDPAKIESHRGNGLMALESYLQGLNKMDVIVKSRDTRLLVSTFRVMAFDGMRLGKDNSNNGELIGRYWWPYTYAQIHRLTAFYNRTLRAWAEMKGHAVIPIDEQMPWQPDLYGDAMHEQSAGEALHAWIVLQQLMSRIREDLAQHRLPRPPRAHQDVEWSVNIERTRVAAILDSVAGAPPPPSPPEPPPAVADDVPGAFPLSTIASAYAKAEVVPGDVPLIRTAMEPTAYAAVVPIAASAAAGLKGRGWVGVRIRVEEGRISVGVLNKSAQKLLAYSNLDRAPEIQEVYLMIADLSDVGSLIITNNRPGEMARSIAELHSVVLKRFRH